MNLIICHQFIYLPTSKNTSYSTLHGLLYCSVLFLYVLYKRIFLNEQDSNYEEPKQFQALNQVTTIHLIKYTICGLNQPYGSKNNYSFQQKFFLANFEVINWPLWSYTIIKAALHTDAFFTISTRHQQTRNLTEFLKFCKLEFSKKKNFNED